MEESITVRSSGSFLLFFLPHLSPDFVHEVVYLCPGHRFRVGWIDKLVSFLGEARVVVKIDADCPLHQFVHIGLLILRDCLNLLSELLRQLNL